MGQERVTFGFRNSGFGLGKLPTAGQRNPPTGLNAHAATPLAGRAFPQQHELIFA